MNFNFTHHTKCSVLFLLVDDINSFPFPFVIIQKKTYCKRLAKAIARGLSHNLELTKCMLIGSSRKLESKVALTASIFDHCVNNVSCFKYLGILLSSDFTWTNHVEDMAGKINQTGLAYLGALSIYYHSERASFSIKVLSCPYSSMQT